jgi:hypothetical protein
LDYISWLYYKNPLGPVIGFDAIHKDKVIAHYAVVPTNINNYKGLLSLNTATHPSFRSQGLHIYLANRTFKLVENKFDFVVGVANNNSVSNFVKKLNFEKLGELNVRFGSLERSSIGSKKYTIDELIWKTESPKSNFNWNLISSKKAIVTLKPTILPIHLKSIIDLSEPLTLHKKRRRKLKYGFTIDWNSNSKYYFGLPRKLKPAPLFLIIKYLNQKKVHLSSWTFLDFDLF